MVINIYRIHMNPTSSDLSVFVLIVASHGIFVLFAVFDGVTNINIVFLNNPWD